MDFKPSQVEAHEGVLMAEIFFTSDVHSFIYPTDYISEERKSLGYAHLASLFSKDAIIIDGGDVLQGSPLARYEIEKGIRPFFMAEAFNSAGLDVFVPGNHDFNFGPDILKQFLDSLEADVVCANLETDAGLNVKPYVIKETVDGLRILISGVVTDYVNIWESRENLEGLVITDSVEAARRVLEETAAEQIDYRILVYHGGFGEEDGEIRENRGDELSRLGYDILFTGHQHMVIAPERRSVSLVSQAGTKGMFTSHVVFDKTGIVHAEILENNLDLPLAPEMAKLLQDRKEEKTAIDRYLSSVVGTLDFPLEDRGKLESGLKGSSLADFINSVQKDYVSSDVSACSLFNEPVTLSGRVTYGDLFAAYPFSNTLFKLEIDGDILKKAMERSASYFDLDERGRLVISRRFLEPKVEHYNYDFYYGVSYVYDISKPVGERVVSLKLGDIDLLSNPDYRFTIALNSYRATGTGGYEAYRRGRVLSSPKEEIQELLLSSFEKGVFKRAEMADFKVIG